MAINSEFVAAFENHKAGRLEVAEQYCNRVLSADPKHAEAVHLLGLIAFQRGELEVAVQRIGRAIELQSRPSFYNNLGNVLKDLGKLEEAADAYRRALDLAPDHPSILANLGHVRQLQGNLDEAVLSFHKSIQRNPVDAATHFNLGNALVEQGKISEAYDSYSRALNSKPDFAEAQINLANALKDQGKLDEAVAAYRRALQFAPEELGIYTNLGNIFQLQGKLGEALGCFQRAFELEPNSAQSCNNLGVVFQDQGKVEEAITCYRKAVDLNPAYAMARSNLLVALQYRGGLTPAELAAAHGEFERLHAAPLVAERPTLEVDRNPERVLTLGFMSPNFCQHPVGHFVIRALENLDQRQFRVTCYSDRTERDDWTNRFEAVSSGWRETRTLSDTQLAAQIAADRIDILFELAGHTAQNRLLVCARKPAPIQVTWADYVGTTGLAAIDYLLADRYEVRPADDAYYTEQVLRMPDGYISYNPPPYAPSVGSLPALERGFVTFSSFNYRPKISLQIIDVWAKILQRVPNSRLVLKNRGLDDTSVAEPLWTEFATRGIDPARIECLGWSAHRELLAEYQRVDIALDPFPYNGGLTTCESLWMGVPVVTCPGETFASRHSLSHLSNVGLKETIARDLEDYVELAVALAIELPRLAALRRGLRARVAASPLCDGKRFAEGFMSILRDIWRRWCQRD